MPFQKVDGTVVTYEAIAIETTYDYNLTYTPNGCEAYGLSVQVVYTGVTDITVTLQASNDGEHFTDITDVDSMVDGNHVFDLGIPAYRILRIVLTPNSATFDATLIFNAVNLS